MSFSAKRTFLGFVPWCSVDEGSHLSNTTKQAVVSLGSSVIRSRDTVRAFTGLEGLDLVFGWVETETCCFSTTGTFPSVLSDSGQGRRRSGFGFLALMKLFTILGITVMFFFFRWRSRTATTTGLRLGRRGRGSRYFRPEGYLFIMRLGLNGLETGDAGIRTRARFQPVYALVQARTR